MNAPTSLNIEDRLFNLRVSQVVKKLWPSLRPYLPSFILGVTFILLTTALELVAPILIGRAVDTATSANGSKAELTRICMLFLAIVLAKNLFDTIQAYVIQHSGQRITHDLRCVLFAHIERLPVAYFDKNPTGRLLTRVINDIKSLSELFTASISVLVLDFMVIAGTIVAMFLLHWKLAALTLLGFPLVVFTIKVFGYRLAVAYREVRAKLAEINAFLGENIGAISTIQRLSAENERFSRFDHIVLGHQDAQMKSLNVFAKVQPIANVLNGLSMATLLVVGGKWVIEGEITLGIVVAFLGYQRNLFQPIRDLVEKYNTFLSAMVSAERVVGILDEKTETDPTSGLRRSERATAPGVVFDQVHFTYPGRQKSALRDISFTLQPNHSLAVVGATGSGKSTLVRLLLRFYEVDSGNILFAGQPLTQWDRENLRASIGVIHQEIYLFEGTVRENLTLGKTHFQDDYLIEQCRRAQLWHFIADRGGLGMKLYEGGTNLSIGERQLLSMARILIFDPPMLILDEATSNIDRRLERRLMRAIHAVVRGRTSIVIAHRLSTILECDEILVLDKGELRERGTYDALLKSSVLFKRFHEIHATS